MQSSVSAVRSWLLNWPSVELSLSNLAKSDTSADVFESKFLEICDFLLRYTQQHIYEYKKVSVLRYCSQALFTVELKEIKIESTTILMEMRYVAVFWLTRSTPPMYLLYAATMYGWLIVMTFCSLWLHRRACSSGSSG